MNPRLKLVPAALLCAVLSAACATGQDGAKSAADSARDATDAKYLVERARMTVEGFAGDPKMADFRRLLSDAKGVFVAPEVLRGAFVFGGSAGSGVFVARDAARSGWNGPVFYGLANVSWGFQAGGDSSEVILLAMTDRGVAAMLSDNVKLGGNVGVAAGPMGGGVAASTANLSADILSYSRAKGAYAGAALEGAVVKTKDSLNRAYYGKEVTPTDVLVRGTVKSPDAARLIETITKSASAK